MFSQTHSMCAGVHSEEHRRLVLGVVLTFRHLAFDIVIPWAGTLPAEIRRAPLAGWREECQTPLGGKSGTAEKRKKDISRTYSKRFLFDHVSCLQLYSETRACRSLYKRTTTQDQLL